MGIRGDRVRFNVGGRIFETSATTLANAGRDSFFGALFDQDWNLLHEASSDVFIDRNPDCFAVLLDFLRTGEVCIPSNVPEKMLYREALFYGLLDQVRNARLGKLNGNRLQFSRSLSGQEPGNSSAIRASPDGGCCVVHGRMVRVYDWMLDLPIILDFKRVNDAGWIDLENIVVSADGGLGLFNTSTGELRNKFSVSHDDQIKSYSAGTLEFSPDHKIFSSCKGGSSGNGIGIWDQITGKQTGFFFGSLGWPLGDACRLQWLSGHNGLLVTTIGPWEDWCYISLLDPREKVMAWNWSNVPARRSLLDRKNKDEQVRDVIVIEGTNSLCAVNYYGDLGFMELRSPRGSFSWSSMQQRQSWRKLIKDGESCYPKLAFHDGQLFLSMSDFISVFSGPGWVLTSRLHRSQGGSLRDFSIGGDRLFALHSEENVFDIWETAFIHSMN